MGCTCCAQRPSEIQAIWDTRTLLVYIKNRLSYARGKTKRLGTRPPRLSWGECLILKAKVKLLPWNLILLAALTILVLIFSFFCDARVEGRRTPSRSGRRDWRATISLLGTHKERVSWVPAWQRVPMEMVSRRMGRKACRDCGVTGVLRGNCGPPIVEDCWI